MKKRIWARNHSTQMYTRESLFSRKRRTKVQKVRKTTKKQFQEVCQKQDIPLKPR
jgi:hypothetical protein